MFHMSSLLEMYKYTLMSLLFLFWYSLVRRMAEEKWLKSSIISRKGIPEILKVIEELYPDYDTREIREKAQEGLIPNPFVLETSASEAERALAGLLHREQAFFFLSYIQLLLEQSFEKGEVAGEPSVAEEVDKLLLVGADALAHAILVLIGIEKTHNIAIEIAPLLSQIVPIAVILRRDKVAEDVLTLIFAVTEKPDKKEDKVALAEAFAKGFEEVNLMKIAEELRSLASKVES